MPTFPEGIDPDPADMMRWYEQQGPPGDVARAEMQAAREAAIDSLYEDAIEMLGGTSQRELGNVLGMPKGARGYDAYGTVEGSDFTSKTNPEFWTPDESTEIYEGRLGSAGLMDSTNPNTVVARDWWLGLDREAKEAYHAIYRDVRGIDNSIAGRTLEDYEVMEMHQWHNPEADFPTLNVPTDQLDVLTLDGLAEIQGVDPRDVTETHIQEAIDSGWAAPEEIAAIRKELEGLPGTPELPDGAAYYQPKNYRIKREIDRELEAYGPDIIAAHRAEVSPTASPIGINEEGTGLGIEFLYPYDIDHWGHSLFTLEQLQSIQRIAARVGVEVDQIKTYLRYHSAGGSR
jgi:hypothetical protein